MSFKTTLDNYWSILASCLLVQYGIIIVLHMKRFCWLVCIGLMVVCHGLFTRAMHVYHNYLPKVTLTWPSKVPKYNYYLSISQDTTLKLDGYPQMESLKQLFDLKLYQQNDTTKRVGELNPTRSAATNQLLVGDIVNVEAQVLINESQEETRTLNISDDLYKWFNQTQNVYDIPISLFATLMQQERLIECSEKLTLLSIMKSDMSCVNIDGKLLVP